MNSGPGCAGGAEIYDLRLFASRIPPGHPKLARAIKRWLNAHSVSTDVEMARAFVRDSLRFHQTGRVSLNNTKTALVQMGIIYYARALERHSQHRETVKLGERMTAAQGQMHEHIVGLRDEALDQVGTRLPAGHGRSLTVC
jgi:hypothetical protein